MAELKVEMKAGKRVDCLVSLEDLLMAVSKAVLMDKKKAVD